MPNASRPSAVIRHRRIGTASTRRRANNVRRLRELQARAAKAFSLVSTPDPSLPGLTPQVGFTRLAAHNTCTTRASPSCGAIHLLWKSVLAKKDGPAGQARG